MNGTTYKRANTLCEQWQIKLVWNNQTNNKNHLVLFVSICTYFSIYDLFKIVTILSVYTDEIPRPFST